MSEPYRDDSYDTPLPDCGGQYADDDLIEDGWSGPAWCADCGTTTIHADYCDEDGANRLTACRTCRRVLRFHPFTS